MELLEFARGPALAFSVAVFLLGLAWRLYGIVRRPRKPDHTEPRRTDTAVGGLRAIFVKMLAPKGVKMRGPAMLNAYGYHLGIALVVLAFAPHIAFIERHTGIGWPALPDPVAYLATGVAILGLVLALLARLTDGVLRLLSNFDDYFSWVVTMLPLITGMALIERPYHPAPVVAPELPTTPALLAIHLLSLELLLVWLPFGKLAHAALVFVSRWRTGADFTRKGAAV
jgi:nitrate reductase gamma subunit